ncbi:hypothetical protein [Thalassococcus sp. S3]|uniref:hypothetical protein n=1 Tax=Thalassococcus sp. S3 TaxID=2017482 RepID=UPI0010246218|nr:hypothetical protein [Thalassococcus sp. S3]QBF31464.1 hypothetical protein CFI11_09565 [Thalassococcus sp. S3]
MLGVVLWSDPHEKKAVIWCEDHGDLAFYRGASDAKGTECILDAGDLVEFEMTTERHLRLAHDPQLVSEGLYPGIAESLAPQSVPRKPAPRESAKIIPFARYVPGHKRQVREAIGVTG